MKAENDIDTEPGGVTVWRSLFGGSIFVGRFKLWGFLLAYLVIGGLFFAIVTH